jgi:hypothetical protein
MKFEGLIKSVAAQHRARHSYADWSSTNLLVRLVLLRHRARVCILRIIGAEGAEGWQSALRRASQMADNPTPKVLAELYAVWPHVEPLQFLVWARLECEAVATEVRRRLDALVVAPALMHTLGQQTFTDSLTDLKDALHVRRLTVHAQYRHEEDSSDLQQVAVERAVRRYRYLTEGIAVTQMISDHEMLALVSPPDFGLPPLPDVWAQKIGLGFVKAQCHEALKRFGPLLDGAVESAQGHARQAVRDHVHQRKAQKRRGRPEFEAAFRALHFQAGSDAESLAATNRAYEVAIKQWGSRGERFLRALAAGEPVAAAAKAAGLSRPTAHKYLKELRKDLS